MTHRGVIESVGGGLESDIDKEKSLIKLKNASESEQWEVGFNLLAVALLEVGKALWDRTCPLEHRAKLWEKVRLWVLTKMLGREHPSGSDRTWLLEELDPWELDPEAKDHLWAETGSLCEALGRLLTSTTNMAPAPEFNGPRMLPLVRRGVHWASYSSFTAQERGDLRKLHQLLGDLSRRVSGELSSGAPRDLSSLEKELAQLRSLCIQKTSEVVARIEYTLDRKIPEPRAHIPLGGNQPLGRRTSKSGGDQSGDVEVGSSSRPGSLQQKQTVLNSALLDPVTPSEQFDGSLAGLLSGCTQSGDAEERSRSRSGSLQQKQTDWKSCCTQSGDAEERSRSRSGSLQQKQTDWKSCCPRFRDVEKGRTRSRNLRRELMVCKSELWNNACLWKWIVVAFFLLYVITLAGVIFKPTVGPSAVLLRNDSSCYRTDWMPSMNKYFWNKEETDWDTSSRLCQEKNGTLAVLHDELQVSELLKEYGRRYPWVGLHILEEEFQWLDGTSWNSTVFPLNGYGDCVYLRKDGFSVNECTMRRSSLCRRQPCD